MSPQDDKHPKLRALFLNCTLKRSPKESNTDALIAMSMHIMNDNGVSAEAIRPVDYDLPPGVQPDMTEEGYDKDDWPDLYKKVLESDILVVCTPIWLGEKSSVCTNIIERLYANSSKTNNKGQYVYYSRVGGCLVTGNEDGIKHCSAGVLYALHHVGFTIPPQVDAGWIGEAGPGPSYRDDESGGPDNDFTNRNVAIMTWNLIHFARMLKTNGGIPNEGNNTMAWKDGDRFGLPDKDEIRQLEGGPSQRG